MGEGNVEKEGLELLAFAGGLGEELQGAHDLKAVGELEYDYARVGGVADYQFLVVVGFQTGVLGLDGGYLVQPVHHREDVAAEEPVGDDAGLGPATRRLVQEHCGDALGTEADLSCRDPGDVLGMLDERGAVAALLAFKCFAGYVVGRFDKGPVRVCIRGEQFFDPFHSPCR